MDHAGQRLQGGPVAANNCVRVVTGGNRAFVSGCERLGHCQRAAPPAASGALSLNQ